MYFSVISTYSEAASHKFQFILSAVYRAKLMLKGVNFGSVLDNSIHEVCRKYIKEKFNECHVSVKDYLAL